MFWSSGGSSDGSTLSSWACVPSALSSGSLKRYSGSNFHLACWSISNQLSSSLFSLLSLPRTTNHHLLIWDDLMVLYFLFTEKATTSTSDMDLIESHNYLWGSCRSSSAPNFSGTNYNNFRSFRSLVLVLALATFFYNVCIEWVLIFIFHHRMKLPHFSLYILSMASLHLHLQSIGPGKDRFLPQFPSLAKLFPFVESVLQLYSFVVSKLGTQKE